MKKIEGWQCNNCETIHPTQDECRACETFHSERMAGSKLAGWQFDSLEGKYGQALGFAKNVPTSITIRFTDNVGDFATYKLERYGFKGL